MNNTTLITQPTSATEKVSASAKQYILDADLALDANIDAAIESVIDDGATAQPSAADDEEGVLRRSGKATVFTGLFSEPKYLRKLYKAIHPESDVPIEEFTNITTEAILTNTIYNDLGFTVKNRRIIMMEAQSTWSVNIIYRELEYLVQGWKGYIADTKQNRYSSKVMTLPFPEVYLLFSGKRAYRPEYISFAEEFFPDIADCPIDLKIKVIYYEGKDDILNEYIAFTRIFDKCVRIYGRTEKAVHEILRICKEKGYLAEYFTEHEKEVEATLFDLFDHERIQRDYEYELRKNIREEVTAEITKSVTEEVTKSVTEEVTKSVTEEVTKSVTEEVTKSVTEEVTKSVTEEVTKSVTEKLKAEYEKKHAAEIKALQDRIAELTAQNK